MQKLDILAIAVHPDDIELGCAGTLIKHARKGQKVGIVDLTQGELGTRGTPELRLQEAQAAAEIMGLAARENAGMADGFFQNDKEHQLKLIKYIRKYQPDIVIANAPTDRHPDHGRAAKLIADACFLSGLRKIETEDNGVQQEAWRPARVYHMIQDRYIEPTFIIDVTDTMDQKIEAIKCYKSQFHDPNSDEPVTYIATEGFLNGITYRASMFGKRIGTKFGEGFISETVPGMDDMDALLKPNLS